MQSNRINAVTQYFALSVEMIAVIDALRGTPIYRQKLKKLLNQVQKELELDLELFYKEMDESAELEFINLSDFTDTLTQIILKKDIATTHRLFKSYLAGEVGYMDPVKHKKIMNQVEKL